MRIVTWNVNSVKQRLPRLGPWLDQRRPDVLCLQELKLTADSFDALIGPELTERGYEWVVSGQPGWNGVAIASKVGIADEIVGFPDMPGFPELEARVITATCGGIRTTCVYVPNGREPDSDHYNYKLLWLEKLSAFMADGPAEQVVLGDMNIAPTDADVFDPKAFVGQTHVTPPERAALQHLQDSAQLRDVVRDHWPDARVFSYWDYRAGMFHQDLGMRIDLTLAAQPVADRVKAAWVDREARKGKGPSDHAPVIVDLDEAYDGDIGPVVPPPSRVGPSKKLPQAR